MITGELGPGLLSEDSEQHSLTDVSEVDQAVLADVGARAGLWRDDGPAPSTLLIADDAEL